MHGLTLKNLIVFGSFSAILSACAQAPHGQSRYGSETHITTACCPVAPPCGVYTPCAPPLVLRPAPAVIEYVPVIESRPEPQIVEAPSYVPPAPAPALEPEIYFEPTPEPIPPIYTPPVEAWPEPAPSWPEPATPPPVWVPRK